MRRLPNTGRVRVALAIAAISIVVAGLATAVGASPSTPRPAARAATEPITLVFAGQVVTGGGIEPFVDPYPPIEGGAALQYTVPMDKRLVIDSLYADVYERYVTMGARSGMGVGISTAYPNPECAFPGYQRDYGVALTAPIGETSEGTTELSRTGSLSGPILVEGGRVVNGTAYAPGGDSTVYVKIVAHGRLETAVNPAPPVFDCG